MRSIGAIVLSSCVALTPAYADSHGRAPAASQHAQTPKTTGKPATSTSSSATRASIPLNPIAAKISSKQQLNTRITAMLPKGMTLNQASTAFKNHGQFIAPLHVSQNLGSNCFTPPQPDI